MNVLEKLAYPGEVGAGLLFQAFDGDARRRRSQIQQQTPQEGLGDFLKSSRAAYKEKDLPRVVEKAYLTAISGRPGPVCIEIPIDLQGSFTKLKPKSRLQILQTL